MYHNTGPIESIWGCISVIGAVVLNSSGAFALVIGQAFATVQPRLSIANILKLYVNSMENMHYGTIFYIALWQRDVYQAQVWDLFNI